MRPNRKPGSGRRRVYAVTTGLLILLIAATGSARTWRVPQDQPSIEAGLAAAVAGDTVLVACGNYAETNLVMTDGVVLRSETGLADCATINAGWLGRGLICDNLGPGTSIEGFTFANGVDAAAGGVFCNHSTVTFRDCAFIHNYAGQDGAGFYCNESEPLLERCLFADNVADAGSGGGFCSRLADPILKSCIFRNNRAGGWGGGFYTSGADNAPRLEKCVFEDNTATMGGAVAIKGTLSEMIDCELLDNHADDSGGGLYLDFAANVVVGETRFAGNSALTGKAGLVTGSSSIVLRCCDLDHTTMGGTGDITYDDTDCGAGNTASTWGAVKILYR